MCFAGVFSLVFASLAVILNDLDSVVSGGFFQGYTSIVVVLVLLQAFGGLVVAIAVMSRMRNMISMAIMTSMGIMIGMAIMVIMAP